MYRGTKLIDVLIIADLDQKVFFALDSDPDEVVRIIVKELGATEKTIGSIAIKNEFFFKLYKGTRWTHWASISPNTQVDGFTGTAGVDEADRPRIRLEYTADYDPNASRRVSNPALQNEYRIYAPLDGGHKGV